MADVHRQDQRSFNMSRVKARNTTPEIIIRKALHGQGFRFRLHDRTLPGTPDIVFKKYGAVAFVHGCFWHGHNCPLFKLPQTRTEFWLKKIEGNRERDRVAIERLHSSGWRTLTVWECALRGRGKLEISEVTARCSSFLLDFAPALEIRSHLGAAELPLLGGEFS